MEKTTKCKKCGKEFAYRANKKFCCRRCKELFRDKKKAKLGVPVYHEIRQRCNNSNHKKYKYYGAIGVRCKFSRDDFLEVYNKNKSCQLCRHRFDVSRDGKKVYKNVHRIDPDGHYEDSNILFICSSCHGKLHAIERKPGLNTLMRLYVKYVDVARRVSGVIKLKSLEGPIRKDMPLDD